MEILQGIDMQKRGRKSSAELTTPKSNLLFSEKRLSAPLTLSDAEIQIWNQVINDQPASAFSMIHVPSLELYCRHVIRSRLLADEILNFDIAWLADDDGLKRYDKLLAMAERESRAITALARSLRLTRQSIDQQTVARMNINEVKSRKPWELTETIE